MMSEKRYRNRKIFMKVNPHIESLIESDENFGFIVGYTSKGMPYGLTHEEINADIKDEKMENDNADLPF